MRAADVRRTDQGTWYVDIVAADDEEEDDLGKKTLKTETSRRRVPIHPELLAMGFAEFAQKASAKPEGMLFPCLSPDKYGNYAKYALRRFRELYLPNGMVLEPRQSFYSFRHNFRDALRVSNAPPDALQALGGWSQGNLVSDDYGDKSNPDYQAQFIEKVAFPGVDLSYLRLA